MQSNNKLTPVIIGTLVMTFIALFPIVNFLNILCCSGIMIGGFAGVTSYNKQLTNSGQTLTAKDGGMIGILSGILSAVFVSGFGLLFSLFSNQNPMTEIMNAFSEFGFQIPDSAAYYLDKFSNEFNDHGFSPTLTIFSFITNLIIYPLFGTIGALIAVQIYKKKGNV
ncbi:MAG TPA: hypothetical protein PK294_03625 [Ignavibacteria bacterium]|nr:hypothetical protein [Ignavibacteria bacterium]HQY51703.1 hypothetical protein [Ignavibacteria bacterium]HRA99508.1 hypothetical protein [Ignavibacteria bacterium]